MSDAPVIQKAFRFVLDPTSEQEHFLAACAGASRPWANRGLALELVAERARARFGDEAAGAAGLERVRSLCAPSAVAERLSAIYT
ncbi:MAG: helix-turn-helix domain-containing protein [Actinomycetota bacterium]|nr:helix-turn-helix domain-containing protein [Actinomycetota bacterium]